MDSYLAFDLGAGSGRLMLGQLADERLELVEVHRFANRMVCVDGHLRWDVGALWREMQAGLAICAERHTRQPKSIGIDTWGVDFGLLDADGALVEPPVTYRDARTAGAVEGFLQLMPRERLYELTGVQVIPINTLFQLHAMVRDRDPALARARHLFFMPDLFNYFLTGVRQSEFTFATTSGLFNPNRAGWEPEVFQALGISPDIMLPVVKPGAVIGRLTESVGRATGLDRVMVRAVGSHDTASAVAAIPAAGPGFAYISSGTWSLMGIESPSPIISPDARSRNFTNEGGVDGSFRVLKNITGFWLLQECGRAWNRCDYDELVNLAARAEPLRSLLDPDDADLVNPPDMPRAIAGYCRRTGQLVPETPGQFTRAILESLALAYRRVLEEIQDIRATPVDVIHIIGGGARNQLLCRLTSDATGLPVLAGPIEAAAIGNILVQATPAGQLVNRERIRRITAASFPPERYCPEPTVDWKAAAARFTRIRDRKSESR